MSRGLTRRIASGPPEELDDDEIDDDDELDDDELEEELEDDDEVDDELDDELEDELVPITGVGGVTGPDVCFAPAMARTIPTVIPTTRRHNASTHDVLVPVFLAGPMSGSSV
jgi:hypothetical protein